jgi:hypothetical protein
MPGLALSLILTVGVSLVERSIQNKAARAAAS